MFKLILMLRFLLLSCTVFHNKWDCCWNLWEFSSRAGLAISTQCSVKLLYSVYEPKKQKQGLYMNKLVQQKKSKPS